MLAVLIFTTILGLTLGQQPAEGIFKDEYDNDFDVQELLENPDFLEFFEEFQKQVKNRRTTTTTTTTTTTEAPVFFPKLQAQTTESDLHQHFFGQTEKPKARRRSKPKNQKRIKATESPVTTTTSVPTYILSGAKSSKRVSPKVDSKDGFDEKIFRKQAESAKYEFASETDDTINSNFHQRQEVRDGLAVKGQYSYSDGYFKRTVHYEADDKGFRVIK